MSGGSVEPERGLLLIESRTPLCLRLMHLLIIRIKAQPFQDSKEEEGSRFACHISTKTHSSQVPERTEMANEKGLQELLVGLF